MLQEIIYQLKRPYHLIKTGLLKGLPAEIVTKYPAKELKILLITGTDGKTTSSTLLYHILKSSGKKVALLSTVAAYIGDQEIDTGFHVTSPQPDELHRFLRSMVEQGVEYVVMEATSHGSYQYRTWGITPTIAGITNITHEHLDYHVTWENYATAKAELVAKSPLLIINKDDQSHAFLQKYFKGKSTKVATYSASDHLYYKVTAAIKKRFPEAYNQMNARLVYQISHQLGIDNAKFIAAVTNFPGVPGRMQDLKISAPYRVVVDFAHTPNALKQALIALRTQLTSQRKKGRLIAIFGCAGLRDVSKRPMMGRAGAELADLALFTAEDPRTEDIWTIFRQMKSDLGTFHQKVVTIPDRRDALVFALNKIAQPGDIVGIFGKGHEKSMCYGTVEYPWSDQLAVQEIISGNT